MAGAAIPARPRGAGPRNGCRRGYARDHNRRLIGVAGDLIASWLDAAALTHPGL